MRRPRGTQARIWLYATGDHSVVDVQKPAGGSNDTQPMWLGDRVYFLSDRDSEFNLYSADAQGGDVTLGFPQLLDGGGITAPNLGIWTEEGFVVENVGVPPDVEVEQTPAEVIAGHDPQLEKAIELALQALAEDPPHAYEKPPYPIRTRQQE